MDKVKLFTQKYIKQNVPPLRSGDTVKVHERIKEKDRERIQIFEGLVIVTKHGTKGPNATFTVRKIAVHGIGVEKTFPLHSPIIQKIEVVKHDKVRRAKLYYVRDLRGKKKKRKAAKMLGMVYEEPPEETQDTSEEEQEDSTATPKAESTSSNDQLPISNDQTNISNQIPKKDEKSEEKQVEEKK